MKKAIAVILIVVLIVSLSITCYAKSDYIIEMQKIKIEDETENTDVLSLTYKNELYLPLRLICEEMGFDIQWIEQGKIKVNTGFNWFKQESPSYYVDEITALKLADVIFTKHFGNESICNSHVVVDETEQYYTIQSFGYGYAYNEDGSMVRYENKNNAAVKISKNNGHIMNVIKIPETVNLNNEERTLNYFEENYEMEIDGTFQKENVITVNNRIYLPAWKLQLLLNLSIEPDNEVIHIRKSNVNLTKETLMGMAYVYSSSSDAIVSIMSNSIPVVLDNNGEIGITWLKVSIDKTECVGEVYPTGSGKSIRLSTKDGALLEYWFKEQSK